MIIDIHRIPDNELKNWNAFVLAQRDGTVFHTTHWLNFQPKGKTVFYGFYLNGNLVGGFPINEIKKAGFSIIAQPTMTPYNQPVFCDDIICSNQIKLFEDPLKRLLSTYDSYRISSIYTANTMFDSLFGNGPTHQFRTQTIYTRDFTETGYSSSLKRNINKAIRNKISIEITCDFDSIYNLSKASYNHSGRKHPFTKDNFTALCRELEEFGLGKGFVAKKSDGECIAGCFLPMDNHRAYNVTNGINRDFKDLNPGGLLLHEVINFCKSKLIDFDFEGSQQDRIYNFFKRYGGEEQTFLHYHHIASKTLKLAKTLKLIKL